MHRAVGAKGWLADRKHAHLFADLAHARRYREPFFFGGSVFWRIVAEHTRARSGDLPVVLGDLNPFVCDLLVALRDHPLELLAQIAERPSCEETFFACRHRLNQWVRRERSLDPAALVPRAADFLAMMVLGFNGLWRVNKSGEINVPIGRTASGKPAKMPEQSAIMAAHRALVRCRADVRHGDFAAQLSDVGEGELIFLDCPYDETFTGYTAGGFSSGQKASAEQGSLFAAAEMLPTRSDLARLREACDQIDRAGSRFIACNLDTESVRAMFDGYTIERVEVRHSVSCDAETRGAVGEVLIRNWR